MDLADAIKALVGAGPPASRAPPPNLRTLATQASASSTNQRKPAKGRESGSTGLADANSIELELEASINAHPALQLDVWKAIVSQLHTGLISAKYAKKAGIELSLAVKLVNGFLKQGTAVASHAAFLSHLGAILWAVAALLGELTSTAASSSSSSTIDPPSVSLPAALHGQTGLHASEDEDEAELAANLVRTAQHGADEFTVGTASASAPDSLPVWVGSSGSSLGFGGGSGMSVAGSVVGPIGGAAGTHGDIAAGAAARMLSKLEDITELVKAASEAYFLASSPISSEAGRPTLLEHLRQSVPPTTSTSTSTVPIGCPILALLAGSLKALFLAAGSSGSNLKRLSVLLLSQSPASHLAAADSSSPLLLTLLRVRDACVGEASLGSAMGVVDEACTVASTIEALLGRCLFNDDAVNGYAMAFSRGLLMAQGAALVYVDSAKQQDDAQQHGSPSAAEAVTAHTLLYPKTLSQESKLFSLLDARQPAAAADSAEVEAAHRSFPYLLATYCQRHADLVSTGELKAQGGSTAASSASAAAAAAGAASSQAAVGSKRPRDEVEASAGKSNMPKRQKGGEGQQAGKAVAVNPAAHAAFSAISASPRFAFFAELASIAVMFPGQNDQLGSSSSSSSVSGADFPFSLSVPALTPSSWASRMRSLAALLSTAVQQGIYDVRADTYPHPQTAIMWALAKWVLAVLTSVGSDDGRGSGSGSTSQLFHAAVGVLVPLLELSHASVQPFFEPIVRALLRLLPVSGEVHEGPCLSAIELLFVKSLELYSRLRDVSTCLASFSALLSPSSTDARLSLAEARLLHRTILSQSVISAFAQSMRDAPTGQPPALGKQLGSELERAVEQLEKAAASAVLSAPKTGSKKGKESAPGPSSGSEGSNELEARSLACHALTVLSCEYLRQLQVVNTTTAVMTHLHRAVFFGVLGYARLLPLAASLPQASSPVSTCRISAVTLLNASCDAVLAVSPYAAVRKHVAGLGYPTPSPLSPLTAAWPVALYEEAAASVAALPTKHCAEKVDHGGDVLTLCRLLSASGLPLAPVALSAGLRLAESRMRLLRIVLASPTHSSAQDSATLSAAASELADFFLDSAATSGSANSSSVVHNGAAAAVDIACPFVRGAKVASFAGKIVKAAAHGDSSAVSMLLEARTYQIPSLSTALRVAVAEHCTLTSRSLGTTPEGGSFAALAGLFQLLLTVPHLLPTVSADESGDACLDQLASSLEGALLWALHSSPLTATDAGQVQSFVANAATLTERLLQTFSSRLSALAITLSPHILKRIRTGGPGQTSDVALLALYETCLVAQASSTPAQGAERKQDKKRKSMSEAAPNSSVLFGLFDCADLSASGSAPQVALTARLGVARLRAVLRVVAAHKPMPALGSLFASYRLLAASVLARARTDAPTSLGPAADLAAACFGLAVVHASTSTSVDASLTSMLSSAVDLHRQVASSLVAARTSAVAADTEPYQEFVSTTTEALKLASAMRGATASVLRAAVSSLLVDGTGSGKGDDSELAFLLLYAHQACNRIAAGGGGDSAAPDASHDSGLTAATGAADPLLRHLPLSCLATSFRRFLMASLSASGSSASATTEVALLLLQRTLATISACIAEAKLAQPPSPEQGSLSDASEDGTGSSGIGPLSCLYDTLCPWKEPGAPISSAQTLVGSEGDGDMLTLLSDGKHGAADAGTSLFRAALPLLVGLLTRSEASISPLARALCFACMREFAASPRVYSLRSDEANLITQAVSHAIQHHSATLESPQSTRDSFKAEAPVLVDVDVGRPRTSLLQTQGPIVLSARDFTESAGLTLQRSARAGLTAPAASATASSKPAITMEQLCACWLLHSLLKYRREAAISSMPFVTATLQQLFVLIPTAAVVDTPSALEFVDASGGSITSPMTALVRLCEVFTKAVRPMRYHAVTVLSAALPALAQMERVLVTLQAQQALGPAKVGSNPTKDLAASLQDAASPAIFALLDACTKKELQQLHLALAARPAARSLLKKLQRAFEAEVKYLGKT